MRLSELLGAEVHDGNGRLLGRVRELRLIQEGPDVEGFGPAFVIQGILVGPRTVGRVGLTRPDVKGPWLFKVIARWMERRLRFVDWERVHSVSEGVIEIRSASGGS